MVPQVVAMGAEQRCSQEPEEHGVKPAEHGRVIILLDGITPLCSACAVERLQGRAS